MDFQRSGENQEEINLCALCRNLISIRLHHWEIPGADKNNFHPVRLECIVGAGEVGYEDGNGSQTFTQPYELCMEYRYKY